MSSVTDISGSYKSWNIAVPQDVACIIESLIDGNKFTSRSQAITALVREAFRLPRVQGPVGALVHQEDNR
jgi:hypothetical protein